MNRPPWPVASIAVCCVFAIASLAASPPASGLTPATPAARVAIGYCVGLKDIAAAQAAGFDYVQGYHYCAALPADQCLAWIAEFNAAGLVAAGDTTITAALRPRSGKLGAGLFIAGTPPRVLSSARSK